jgi:hypothetical protein
MKFVFRSILFLIITLLLFNAVPFSKAATSFDVGSLLLKVSITQGKVATPSRIERIFSTPVFEAASSS